MTTFCIANRPFPAVVNVVNKGTWERRAYYPERTCLLEWRDNGEGYPPSVRCSACGGWLDAVTDVEDVAQFNHCPICGARIERGSE